MSNQETTTVQQRQAATKPETVTVTKSAPKAPAKEASLPPTKPAAKPAAKPTAKPAVKEPPVLLSLQKINVKLVVALDLGMDVAEASAAEERTLRAAPIWLNGIQQPVNLANPLATVNVKKAGNKPRGLVRHAILDVLNLLDPFVNNPPTYVGSADDVHSLASGLASALQTRVANTLGLGDPRNSEIPLGAPDVDPNVSALVATETPDPATISLSDIVNVSVDLIGDTNNLVASDVGSTTPLSFVVSLYVRPRAIYQSLIKNLDERSLVFSKQIQSAWAVIVNAVNKQFGSENPAVEPNLVVSGRADDFLLADAMYLFTEVLNQTGVAETTLDVYSKRSAVPAHLAPISERLFKNGDVVAWFTRAYEAESESEQSEEATA